MAARNAGSLHILGVLCGLAAGVWLGAAEAPAKLVDAGLSPFAVSLCMVAGVFTARWTFPTLMKGTGFVFADLAARPHLIVWALLAGALWAVANTLTVFAIRDVGLAVAFPLWNANSLIGLLWGCLLFRELRGATAANKAKVVLGGLCILAAAILLGFSTLQGGAGGQASPHAARGLLAAAGASLMWGTMYVPYRKAYLSGMNPLSFVTIFTFGELGTMLALTWSLDSGTSLAPLLHSRRLLFWLFLGGFIWVIGDLFQQFATKYLGIGRGIPLSNTNQLWGLAWGALVFGELNGADGAHLALVVGGSLLMVLGALAISTASACTSELQSRDAALERECFRYGLDLRETRDAQDGAHIQTGARRWWDWAIVAAAAGLFAWLGSGATLPPLAMDMGWVGALSVLLLVALGIGGWSLWVRTRFG